MGALRRIWAIARKEIQVLLARPLERRVVIFPPIVLMFVFSWAATLEVKNVDFGVLDQDRGFWSQELTNRVLASPTFRSVRYLDSPEQARQALDLQRVLFVLVFDSDFSRKIEAQESAVIQVRLDGRRANAAQIARNYLGLIVEGLSRDTPLYQTVSLNYEPPLTQAAVLNWFNPNLDFRWFYLPALIGIMSMMMGCVITGISVARERELGTFDQMLVSPAQPTEIAIAKLIPGVLVAMTHGTIFVLGAHFVFGVPIEGSLAILYAAMIVFAISVSGIGLMVSSLAATQQQAFLGVFTVAVPLIIMSGFASPVSNMPQALQIAGAVDPLRYFLSIIVGVFLKDMSLQSAVLDLLKMTLIGLVTCFVAINMFKRRA